MSKTLVIAAHPDDEVLGCGGTMARYAAAGHEVFTLILGEGVTARDDIRDSESKKEELTRLRNDARKANSILGVKEVFFGDLPDNRFDTVPFLEIVKSVENSVSKLHPDTIFTHFSGDLNIDHRLTARAVMTACRPLPDSFVRNLFSFEVLSSTEWDYSAAFHPDSHRDITDHIKLKQQAMSAYQSELREFPHPRSIKGIETAAVYRGMQVGLEFAEAFVTLRRME